MVLDFHSTTMATIEAVDKSMTDEQRKLERKRRRQQRVINIFWSQLSWIRYAVDITR